MKHFQRHALAIALVHLLVEHDSDDGLPLLGRVLEQLIWLVLMVYLVQMIYLVRNLLAFLINLL